MLRHPLSLAKVIAILAPQVAMTCMAMTFGAMLWAEHRHKSRADPDIENGTLGVPFLRDPSQAQSDGHTLKVPQQKYEAEVARARAKEALETAVVAEAAQKVLEARLAETALENLLADQGCEHAEELSALRAAAKHSLESALAEKDAGHAEEMASLRAAHRANAATMSEAQARDFEATDQKQRQLEEELCSELRVAEACQWQRERSARTAEEDVVQLRAEVAQLAAGELAEAAEAHRRCAQLEAGESAEAAIAMEHRRAVLRFEAGEQA
mmetsp:Transcript_103699/g.317538  ORF Transcript_103699/g.317538 Transcript_103699/m.317538 type:complete len:269 (-) Transcript_103699:139-945(-)